MIKQIEILQDSIVISEERKVFFKTKMQTSKVYLSLIEKIEKIEKITEDGQLIGIVLWHGNEDEVLYAIGIKNYNEDLVELYNKIMNSVEDMDIKVIETKL